MAKRFTVQVTITDETTRPVGLMGNNPHQVTQSQDIVHVSTQADDVMTAITRAMNVLDMHRTEFLGEDVDTTAWNPDGGNRPVERDYPTAADILDGQPGSGTADVTRSMHTPLRINEANPTKA